MRPKLCRRLEELEKIGAATAARTESSESADSALDTVRAILGANNFQAEPNESLEQTFARFMGISPQELRAELTRRAYGN